MSRIIMQVVVRSHHSRHGGSWADQFGRPTINLIQLYSSELLAAVRQQGGICHSGLLYIVVKVLWPRAYLCTVSTLLDACARTDCEAKFVACCKCNACFRLSVMQ